MRVRVSTVAALALALAIVAALPAHAAPRSSRQAERAGLFSRLVGFLGGLPDRLVAVWGASGSGIDPFGGPGTPPPVQGSGLGNVAGGEGQPLNQ
jgi:peptidoglycan/LPS O-acetylase OafA/YrhL